MSCISVVAVGPAVSVVSIPQSSVSITPLDACLQGGTAVSFLQINTTQITLIPGPKGDDGAAGVKGDDGATGPRGADGTSAPTPFDWSPPSAQAIWIVPHNLNRYPSVTLEDSLGDIVSGKASYLDSNTIRLEFSAPIIGTVHLN